uniref:Uncharacterized protein n=1 Tax=Oncorhynchus tshawytscha TaxID=74940 RepID=A0A8C8FQP7_ONCTS
MCLLLRSCVRLATLPSIPDLVECCRDDCPPISTEELCQSDHQVLGHLPDQGPSPPIAQAPRRGFTLDLTHPVEYSILDSANFETFLNERVKVNGKTGNLANLVEINHLKNKIHVTEPAFQEKNNLEEKETHTYKDEKNNLRDWLRVMLADKETYELRYFQISQEEDNDE